MPETSVIPPYVPPLFISAQTLDIIHRRMLASMPDDIDKAELSIPWDYTRPSAMAKAELIEFELNETIQLIFPHWAYAEWLDLHAELEGLKRRAANRAFGYLTVTARAGHVVEQGFLFATPANITPSIIFEADETIIFDDEPDGRGNVTKTVPVLAVEGGRIGNVPPDSIVLMVRPANEISFVKNAEATTGGTPEETDHDLRLRVLEMIRRGLSWTGRDADYVRWAMEVPGVGGVMVDPEWDDPTLPENFVWIDSMGNRRKAGAVRIFIIDANGLPANQQIIDAVYDWIIRPNNRLERRAPIGAHLTVVAPEPMTVDISSRVFLREGENLAVVKERFTQWIFQYWIEAMQENDLQDVFSGISQNFIKYVQVGARLAKTPGIRDYDHSTFTINGGDSNILIPPGFFPVTGEVNLYE